MDNLNFKFSAYQEDEKIIVTISMDGAKAMFVYTDVDSMSVLVENIQKILNYAIDDFLLREKFKDQIDNELDNWINGE